MMDKETFLKTRLPERTVDVDGVGEVRVRGLSRAEGARLKDFVDDPEAGEVFVLAAGLVDPALTADEVRLWQAAATAGEVEAVTTAILELSGLLPDAVGAAQRSFQPQPGEAAGVLPGPDAGDDGGPPP